MGNGELSPDRSDNGYLSVDANPAENFSLAIHFRIARGAAPAVPPQPTAPCCGFSFDFRQPQRSFLTRSTARWCRSTLLATQVRRSHRRPVAWQDGRVHQAMNGGVAGRSARSLRRDASKPGAEDAPSSTAIRLIGGMTMHHGKIAEMRAGGKKT